MTSKNPLFGKGIYLWRIERAQPFTTLLTNLIKANITHIIIKIADGDDEYNSPEDLRLLVSQLRSGFPSLQIWGYQYLYSGVHLKDGQYLYSPVFSRPKAEAELASKLLSTIRLDGLVLDIEAEYERYNPESRIQEYFDTLLPSLSPNFPLAYSTFRYPTVHPTIPWRTLATHCTIAMPQVYWMQDTTPTAGWTQLARSYSEYCTLYDQFDIPLRYIPTGAAFHEQGWAATPQQVSLFLQQAKQLSTSDKCSPVDGVNFWEYYYAAVDTPQLWKSIAEFKWSEDQGEPPMPDQTYTQLTVNVGKGSRANLRLTPLGKIITTLPDGTTLAGVNPVLDRNGAKWWYVGSGYIAESVIIKGD